MGNHLEGDSEDFFLSEQRLGELLVFVAFGYVDCGRQKTRGVKGFFGQDVDERFETLRPDVGRIEFELYGFCVGIGYFAVGAHIGAFLLAAELTQFFGVRHRGGCVVQVEEIAVFVDCAEVEGQVVEYAFEAFSFRDFFKRAFCRFFTEYEGDGRDRNGEYNKCNCKRRRD